MKSMPCKGKNDKKINFPHHSKSDGFWPSNGLYFSWGITGFNRKSYCTSETVLYLTKNDEDFVKKYIIEKKQWF